MLRFVGHGGYDFVADECARLVMTYADDTVTLSNVPAEIYNFVRAIPYKPEEVETLKRPSVTIRDGGDCDDKTIVLCAWAQRRALPWRMVLAGVKKEPGRFHHIFPQIKIDGEWVTFDATYPYMSLGAKMKPYNNFKICMDNDKARGVKI
jgi:transglutaminase-like putative cysteine protease